MNKSDAVIDNQFSINFLFFCFLIMMDRYGHFDGNFMGIFLKIFSKTHRFILISWSIMVAGIFCSKSSICWSCSATSCILAILLFLDEPDLGLIILVVVATSSECVDEWLEPSASFGSAFSMSASSANTNKKGCRKLIKSLSCRYLNVQKGFRGFLVIFGNFQ